MHPAIQKLAQRLGTEIVSRDAFETWLYDGVTIASHYWVRPDPLDLPGTQYYFEPYAVHYDDVTLLHELGHLAAACSEQKDLPEYGLAMGIATGSGYGRAGGEFRNLDGTLKHYNPENFSGLVDTEEQEIQETLAQLLSIFWGQQYGVTFWMREWNLTPNWEFYFQYKIAQKDGLPHTEESLRLVWSALIRFRNIWSRYDVGLDDRAGTVAAASPEDSGDA